MPGRVAPQGRAADTTDPVPRVVDVGPPRPAVVVARKVTAVPPHVARASVGLAVVEGGRAVPVGHRLAGAGPAIHAVHAPPLGVLRLVPGRATGLLQTPVGLSPFDTFRVPEEVLRLPIQTNFCILRSFFSLLS